MAIANLHETLLQYTLRKNNLNIELANLASAKELALMEQADVQRLQNAEKQGTRDYFKHLYNNDEELQEAYRNYTEIPDFEEEIDKIVAKFQEKADELTAWETQVNAQMEVDGTELKEIESYMQYFKTALQTNIKEDYNFGLNAN